MSSLGPSSLSQMCTAGEGLGLCSAPRTTLSHRAAEEEPSGANQELAQLLSRAALPLAPEPCSPGLGGASPVRKLWISPIVPWL